MNSPAVTFEVASRFQNLRRKYVAVRVVTCLATTFAIAVLCLALLAVGDYLWEWPLLIRRVLATVTCAGLIVFSLLQFVRVFGDSRQGQFAGSLESRFDSLGQRLRTVLEAVDGRLRAPEPMLSALGHQTLGRWETASPTKILPIRAATMALAGCLVTLVLGLSAIVWDSDWRTALQRAIGSDRAYTTLEVAPGDTRLLEGTPLTLILQLQGRTDREVTLRYRDADQESWIESELLPSADKPDPRHASFEAALGKLTNPVEYQFVTSAGTTPLYRVDVQPFIQVAKFETLVTPPTYTRLEPRSFSATEITVLAGSRVTVTIETNHPLAEASLQIGEKSSMLRVVDTLRSEMPTRWSFDLASSEAVHWQFSGSGKDGTPISPVKGRLRIRFDEEPRIEWRDPAEEIKVHMLAELPMRAQISDDYGLTESGIVFQPGDGEEYVLKAWSQAELEGDLASDSVTTQLRLEELLPLESLRLSESDFVTYYAYAIDNREGSPQRIETDMRYIDIQPLRQFWAEVEADPNQNLGNGPVITQLEEIIRRQRFLINRTRRESRNQSVDMTAADLTEQLPKIERMVSSQSELADLTRFLMEFLVSRGNDDTESLSQAEAAMLLAVDSLTKADFVSALVQEEEAGRALAEARNTLEIALSKNQSPQQAAQMRAFIRQMQQKLRRAQPKTDKQLADTLEQIAAEQKRLATELEGKANQAITPESPVAGSTNTGEASTGEASTGEASTGEAGTGEASTGEAGTGEVGTGEVGTGEAGTGEVGTGEAGTGEAGTGEAGTGEAGTGEAGTGEAGTGEAGAEVAGEAGAAPDGNETSEKSTEGAGEVQKTDEEIKPETREQDLVERVRSIESGLSQEVKRSSLVTKRLEESIKAMDDLIGKLRDASSTATDNPPNPTSKEAMNASSATAHEIADELRELATHISALSQTEPANRVAALRDMTVALSNMEREVSSVTAKAADLRTSSTPSNLPASEKSSAIDAELEKGRKTVNRMGRRLDERASTIEDVLKTAPDLGSLEANEINDSIQKFVDENEFLDDLANSRSAMEKAIEAKETTEWSQSASERSADYADAAVQLDNFYRQLVTPRTDQLRKLEAIASQLSKALSEQKGGKGSGKTDEPQDEKSKGGSAEALKRELQIGLKEAELEDLVEILAGGGEDEMEEQDSSGGNDPAFLTSDNNSKTGLQFSVNKSDLASGVARIQKELRLRIQELIMLEIAADRDSPVPPQYRELIDGYFRTIAGGDATTTGITQ